MDQCHWFHGFTSGSTFTRGHQWKCKFCENLVSKKGYEIVSESYVVFLNKLFRYIIYFSFAKITSALISTIFDSRSIYHIHFDRLVRFSKTVCFELRPLTRDENTRKFVFNRVRSCSIFQGKMCSCSLYACSFIPAVHNGFDRPIPSKKELINHFISIYEGF